MWTWLDKIGEIIIYLSSSPDTDKVEDEEVDVPLAQVVKELHLNLGEPTVMDIVNDRGQ